MKKTFKMALAFGLLIAMLAGMMVSAAGETTDTGKIVITNEITDTGIDLAGKEFSAYKVFDATVSGTTGAVSYAIASDFEQFFADKGMTTQAAAEQYIHNQETDMAALVVELRTYIDENDIDPTGTTGVVTAIGENGQSLETGALAYGYYVVLDTSTNKSTMSAGMLTTLSGADARIALKGSQPKIDKDIWHNDKEEDGAWDSVGDYEIGDKVDFKITATLPTTTEGYTDYEYIITDEMSDGLGLVQGTVEVFVDKNESIKIEPPLFTYSAVGNGFSLDVDVEAIKAAYPNTTALYIRYQGYVTKDANVGFDNENNKVILDYSNNPYDEESKGKSEDTVYSYTFALDVDKVDSDGEPLAGAVFALYEGETAIYLAPAGEAGVYYVDPDEKVDETTFAGCITTDASGEFTIKGLDDAKAYTLKEVKAPEGYTKGEDITFTITPTYSGTVLKSVATDNSEVADGNQDAVLSTTVINTSSELFPGTGGMGTPIFLIVGSVIMILSVGFFAVRRRRAY